MSAQLEDREVSKTFGGVQAVREIADLPPDRIAALGVAGTLQNPTLFEGRRRP